MSKSKKSRFMKATTFLARLNGTVESLPTEAEKREALAKIDKIVDFLRSLSGAISALPTGESVTELSQALRSLESLMAKVETNPAFAGLAAPTQAGRSRGRKTPSGGADTLGAREALDSLESLPTDELRNKLFDEEAYSLAKLRGMASALGISGADKLARESVAHQIVTKIGNYRGYQTLSGAGQQE